MKSLHHLLLALLLSVGVLSCPAAGANNVNQVDRLMQLSGLDAQISQYPAQIETGMSQAAGETGLSPEEQARLQIIMREVFNSESLRTSIRQYLLENIDTDVIDQALAWLESPLGRTITGLEEAASTPAAITAMQQQMNELASRPGRVEAMQRLDQATGATASTIGMSANVSAAIAIPLIMNLPAEQRPDMDMVIDSIAAETQSRRQSFELLTMMSFLYTYRSLGDEDLERYIAFSESAAGRLYHDAAIGAVRHAFIQHGKQVGERLSEAEQVAQQKI